jgi:hypothetical protein
MIKIMIEPTKNANAVSGRPDLKIVIGPPRPMAIQRKMYA